MLTLFPEIKPYTRHALVVDSLHTLYVDESGNPNGIPVLFVHGGPGAGCDSNSRRWFDPARYRIVTFDQRGCGRSTPHASLCNNTTWDLVADMERIREALGIQRWRFVGLYVVAGVRPNLPRPRAGAHLARHFSLPSARY